jgi:2-methylcitrate dehydratase PrpD
VVTAAVLALGDEVVAPVLDAMAGGYRVLCATAATYAPDAQRRGLRPTGVFGPVGAAAASAIALGLDAEGVASSIGLAAALSGGSNQSWNAGSDEWVLQAGAAARVGVEAAQFVAGGVTAAADAIEGKTGWSVAFFADPGAQRLVDSLDAGAPGVDVVAIKPYPVSGIAQVPTWMACEAHRRAAGAPITAAELTMNAAEAAYPGSLVTKPRTRSAALMSVAFCVSTGLAEGRIRLAALNDPAATAGPAVRVEPTADLAETTSRLRADAGGEEIVLERSGADILFPSWSDTANRVGDLADRSEAAQSLVDAVVTELSADAPRVAQLAAAIERNR